MYVDRLKQCSTTFASNLSNAHYVEAVIGKPSEDVFSDVVGERHPLPERLVGVSPQTGVQFLQTFTHKTGYGVNSRVQT